jgi:hypothetical protein
MYKNKRNSIQSIIHLCAYSAAQMSYIKQAEQRKKGTKQTQANKRQNRATHIIWKILQIQ